MSSIQPPGLIELPGMKGSIEIQFDLTKGNVNLVAGGLALPTIVQVLLMAVQGAVAQWAQIDAGIIRAGSLGGSSDGGGKETSKKENDDGGGGGPDNAA